MKKIKYSILLFAAVLLCGQGFAQNAHLYGMLTSGHGFTPADILQYSQNYGMFNTARSSAMGGAFTSLGADLSSIGTNPAGLGMYRTSTYGFSPSMTFSNTLNDHAAFRTDKNRFAFNNIGVVLNVSQASRGLVSFSMGFSYNKAADFNFRTGVKLAPGTSSINDIFTLQLNGLYEFMGSGNWSGIKTSQLRNPFAENSGIYLDEWGASLAYLSRAVDNVGESRYRTPGLGPDASITPELMYESRGSIGEYNISGGMNFNNVFYLGFGLTMQDIFHRQETLYTERYGYDGTGSNPLQTYMTYMNYDQYATLSGAGINFKAGFILRPIPSLRIGFAVHTPTYVSLSHEYVAGMETEFYGLNNREKHTSYTNLYEYNFNTPTRIMAGISYTLGDFAAISADYERVFYNGMRLANANIEDKEAFKQEITNLYRPANNFKAGVEIKPIPEIALRAGYSYYGSPLSSAPNNSDQSMRFTVTTSDSFSAGVGFRLGRRSTLDIAYIYSRTNYATIVPFYYAGEAIIVDDLGGERFIELIEDPVGPNEDDPFTTWDFITGIRQKRHTITMSFNFLF